MTILVRLENLDKYGVNLTALKKHIDSYLRGNINADIYKNVDINIFEDL